MATYTLAEAPEVIVSVRGKDSLTTRQKALDKIADMLESGELPTEVPKGLNLEQLILTEAPTRTTDAEGDEDQEPLEIVVRELHKFLLLKIRTQRLKQLAVQARQNIDTILTEESIEQDLDQLEEMLKGSYKSLKDFVSALGEYRQTKPGAEAALTILDEALQFNLSIPATLSSSSLTKTEVFAPETKEEMAKETTQTGAEATSEPAKNGRKRRPEPNGALVPGS